MLDKILRPSTPQSSFLKLTATPREETDLPDADGPVTSVQQHEYISTGRGEHLQLKLGKGHAKLRLMRKDSVKDATPSRSSRIPPSIQQEYQEKTFTIIVGKERRQHRREAGLTFVPFSPGFGKSATEVDLMRDSLDNQANSKHSDVSWSDTALRCEGPQPMRTSTRSGITRSAAFKRKQAACSVPIVSRGRRAKRLQMFSMLASPPPSNPNLSKKQPYSRRIRRPAPAKQIAFAKQHSGSKEGLTAKERRMMTSVQSFLVDQWDNYHAQPGKKGTASNPIELRRGPRKGLSSRRQRSSERSIPGGCKFDGLDADTCDPGLSRR